MDYKNPGFSEKLEIKDSTEEDYQFLGATKLSSQVLQSNGDWSDFLPKLEVQRNQFLDTYSCTNFALCNVMEILHKRLYTEEINFSDRYSATTSNTAYRQGNSHKNVADTARKYGFVPEEVYPFLPETTMDKYYGKPSKEIIDMGMKWVVENEFGYEKVARADFDEALKYSPLQVAVDSRTNKISDFKGADHSVVLISGGNNKKVFDSYLNRFINYDTNYPFSFGQKYYYKKIISLIINDMKFQLIRNKGTGAIYLIDSDNNKHHIKTPSILTDYFGKTAWLKSDWIDVDSTDQYPDAKPFTTGSDTIIESLKSLIAAFGKVGKK